MLAFLALATQSPQTIGTTPYEHQIGFLYVPVSLADQPPQQFILDTGSYRSYVTAQGLARLEASGVVPHEGLCPGFPASRDLRPKAPTQDELPYGQRERREGSQGA